MAITESHVLPMSTSVSSPSNKGEENFAIFIFFVLKQMPVACSVTAECFIKTYFYIFYSAYVVVANVFIVLYFRQVPSTAYAGYIPTGTKRTCNCNKVDTCTVAVDKEHMEAQNHSF